MSNAVINHTPVEVANSNTNIASGGELDSTFGTGGYFTGDQNLIFDANQICIIKYLKFFYQEKCFVSVENHTWHILYYCKTL